MDQTLPPLEDLAALDALAHGSLTHLPRPASTQWVRSQLVGRDAHAQTPFGCRRIVYADHVASGRPLRWVEDFIATHVLPMYGNTHTEDSATGALMTALAHEARNLIKASLGAPDCILLFCGTGCTGAIRRLQEVLGLVVPETLRPLVVRSMPALRPLVFVGPYEHHSNEVSWRETIADVVEVPLDASGGIDLRALSEALDKAAGTGRRLIGSFSAASNVTGTLTDTRAIARLLHAHGALACFDFAAAAPHLQIDMRLGEADGYDAVFLSAHKLVGGPGSPGVLAFDPALYNLRSPTAAGGGTVSYVCERGHHFLAGIEQREDAGTPGTVQRIRAALAFMVKDAIGTESIAALEDDMIRRAIRRLRRHPRIRLLGNLQSPRLAILSFLVLCRDGRELHPRLVTRLLNDLFGIQARAGCACAGPYAHRLLGIGPALANAYRDAVLAGYQIVKPGWTRINFSYFLEQAEFDFLQDAIEFIADHGERFIGEYRCNWTTGCWQHPRDEMPASLVTLAAQPLPADTVARHPPSSHDCIRQAHGIVAALAPAGEPAGTSLPPGLPAELVRFRY